MKPCLKCGSALRYADGRCKACAREWGIKYNAANAARMSAKNAVYRVTNKERITKQRAAYRADNAAKIRAQRAERNAANSAKNVARVAKWRVANKERHAKYSAAYYAETKERVLAYRVAHPEIYLARSAAYRAANPDKIRAYKAANHEKNRIYKQNRRARERASGGSLSADIAERLFKLQRGMCACGCKQPLGADYHLDHIMPIVLGGPNEDSNIQLLLARCNLKKHTKHPVDFMRSSGFLL
mgnify:CR=1 FL=1